MKLCDTILKNTVSIMLNLHAQRFYLFSGGCTHFIKPDSYCNYGLVLFILEVSMCLTDQIKRTRTLWKNICYLDLSVVESWLDASSFAWEAKTPFRNQRAVQASRYGQHWPFISVFISFTHLFSFFTRAPTHTKKDNRTALQKMARFAQDFTCYQSLSASFYDGFSQLTLLQSIMRVVSECPLQRRETVWELFYFKTFTIIPWERSFEVKLLGSKRTSSSTAAQKYPEVRVIILASK